MTSVAGPVSSEQVVTSVPGVSGQEDTEMVEEVYELHVQEDGEISATPSQVFTLGLRVDGVIGVFKFHSNGFLN